ncbi:right-handed parallel beta-helix repeat-containing protein [bacterium]|nr:right-handed parallel beta-helix repeat-containing protein [bacterium]
MKYKNRQKLLLLFIILMMPGTGITTVFSADYYVATDGSDSTGNGSELNPWATITFALDSVPDASVILVQPGIYEGRIRIRGTFPSGVTVKSSVPYAALLRSSEKVISAYTHLTGCSGITIEGFEMEHTGPGADPLMIHIDGNGDGSVSHLTFRNNIFHDSYNNDILKINNSTHDIVVEGNMFYNQTGSDEHIDINSAANITVQDNVFFNDFEGSGRTNNNNTSSYIVIKDSNQNDDLYLGSRNIVVKRNIFFNWQGSSGCNFVLAGEDGHPYFEAFDILVENNLMLGNTSNIMRTSVGVKGCRNIVFRHNTISGDLPSLAYAMRLNQEGSNLANENIQFYGNIWSDPTGSMGATTLGGNDDFSDTPPGETTSFTLDTNLYWNGGENIPMDPGELVNYTDDINRVIGNPLLSGQAGLIIPRWNRAGGVFVDGSTNIRQVFVSLVMLYGVPLSGGAARDTANPAYSPMEDILGNPRNIDVGPDIGAYEALVPLPSMSLAGMILLVTVMGIIIFYWHD